MQHYRRTLVPAFMTSSIRNNKLQMASASSVVYDTRGYPKEIFRDGRGFDTKFVCNICELILREPVQAFCGHRFCRVCLEGRLRDSGPMRCQQCQREDPEDVSLITQEQIFPDNGIKREMAKIKVFCANLQCDWQGIFRQYEEHSVLCPYKRVTCQACGKLIIENSFEEHQNTECKSSCEKCGEHVLTKFMRDHLDLTCAKAPVVCPQCGKGELLRVNLPAHQQSVECRGEPVVCPAGCGQIERKDFQDHFRRMQHEIWVVQKLEILNRALDEQVSRNNQLTESRDQSAVGLAQTNEKLALVERQVNELSLRSNTSVESGGIRGTENIEAKIRQVVEMQLQSVNERLDVKAGTFEGISSALHREMEKTITAVEKLERYRQEMASSQDQLQNKIRSLERTVALKEMTIAELELKVQSLEAASFDGTFIWRVTEFAKKHQEALNGRTISIYSPPFYTSRRGYKMCARLYPNGDGMGKGSHLSLFFVVMRGNFDPLLKWPFGQRVTFCLINQNGGEHIIDSFRPDPQSSSFKRPTSDMNIASGCPLFIRLEMLQNPNNGFLKDDIMFLKVSVDVSDLSDPISTFEERVKSQS